MSKKYELNQKGIGYFIKALVDIPRHGVKAGDLGGIVYGEHNLSHEGDCWIEWGSFVINYARVEGNAIVRNNSHACDRAIVYGNAVVENSILYNHCIVADNAAVRHCYLEERANVHGNSHVENLRLSANCFLHGNTRVISPADYRQFDLELHGEITEKDYLFQGPALSSKRYSFAWNTPGGVIVTTGCFHGSLDKYLRAIEETHKNNPEYLQQYRQFHQNFVKHFSE